MRGGALGVAFAWLLVTWPSYTYSDGEASREYAKAIRRAVLENPQVNLEWHRFSASQQAQKAAKGALLPEVNLNATAGREERATPQTAFDPYDAQSGTFSIRQLLFDGFTALETTRERQFESAAQYFQLRNTAEQVGLEVADAYLDTYRHQQLVTFAVDNLIEHREIFLRIQMRAVGGLDADVDLDQAQARLKLAESNLLVELNNLNDLKNLYQRLVGVSPADGLILPGGTLALPSDRHIALNLAFEMNPVYRSAGGNQSREASRISSESRSIFSDDQSAVSKLS